MRRQIKSIFSFVNFVSEGVSSPLKSLQILAMYIHINVFKIIINSTFLIINAIINSLRTFEENDRIEMNVSRNRNDACSSY